MNAKHLSLAIAALLVAGGLWLARPAWRTHAPQTSSMVAGSKTTRGPDHGPSRAVSLPSASQTGPAPGPSNGPNPGQVLNPPARLAPPTPNKRFTDFTPEQRVQFARQGHGPGG
jgi:hypothetical protein